MSDEGRIDPSARATRGEVELFADRTSVAAGETLRVYINASSPWMMNRGIFQLPADKGQWMLSVQHSTDDIDRYLTVFADYCAELVA